MPNSLGSKTIFNFKCEVVACTPLTSCRGKRCILPLICFFFFRYQMLQFLSSVLWGRRPARSQNCAHEKRTLTDTSLISKSRRLMIRVWRTRALVCVLLGHRPLANRVAASFTLSLSLFHRKERLYKYLHIYIRIHIQYTYTDIYMYMCVRTLLTLLCLRTRDVLFKW